MSLSLDEAHAKLCNKNEVTMYRALCILTLTATLLGCASTPTDSKPSEPAELASPDWDALRYEVGGRLIKPQSPLDVCRHEHEGDDCRKLWERMNDPYFLQSQPGTTQSLGWIDAWTSSQSQYAVAAESVEDVIAAVKFARKNKLQLVIRGAGHSYQGRSQAADSLLLWTRKMNRVSIDEAFVPEGAPSGTQGVAALSAEAGTIWAEVYTIATTEGGRYVQGGGCPTVGVAGGFLHSGGFGSYSKRYGSAAASWLEAELVGADGEVIIANEYQHADLFWALRGGGGGTFGVVTRVTLRIHELPESFGLVSGSVKAKSEDAYRTLIAKLVSFSRSQLLNPNWGEKITLGPDNTAKFNMRSSGLSEAQIVAQWQPLIDWVQDNPEQFEGDLQFLVTPAEDMWDTKYWQEHAPQRIILNPGYDPDVYLADLYFWEGARHEAGAFWYSMQSRWIPSSLFTAAREHELVDMLFKASRYAGFEMQYNKGLAEASEDVRARERKTSLNPVALDASMLIIGGAFAENVFPGVPGHEPDMQEGHALKANVEKAFEVIFAATPESGSFSTQSDYFQKDWQKDFFGSNYARLLEVKKKYDPDNFFHVHHGVGSEGL